MRTLRIKNKASLVHAPDSCRANVQKRQQCNATDRKEDTFEKIGTMLIDVLFIKIWKLFWTFEIAG